MFGNETRLADIDFVCTPFDDDSTDERTSPLYVSRRSDSSENDTFVRGVRWLRFFPSSGIYSDNEVQVKDMKTFETSVKTKRIER